MEIQTSSLIGTGAVIAALISGVFSFINLVIGKDQKTSEFRQHWIDATRNDVADLVALAINMRTVASIYEKEAKARQEYPDFSKIYATIKDDSHKLSIAFYRIRLKLNNKKDAATIVSLNAFYKLASSPETNSVDLYKKSEEIIFEFQKLLKKEWERVKRGEVSFFLSKYIALMVLVVSILIIFYNFINLK